MHLPTPAHFLFSASPDIHRGTDGDCGQVGKAGGGKGDGIFLATGSLMKGTTEGQLLLLLLLPR